MLMRPMRLRTWKIHKVRVKKARAPPSRNRTMRIRTSQQQNGHARTATIIRSNSITSSPVLRHPQDGGLGRCRKVGGLRKGRCGVNWWTSTVRLSDGRQHVQKTWSKLFMMIRNCIRSAYSLRTYCHPLQYIRPALWWVLCDLQD